MDLILWRHAEAAPAAGRPEDERKLTAKGRKQAAWVSEWLLRRLPSKITVVTAPARPARETAVALRVRPRVADCLAAGANVDAILEEIGWPSRNGSVVILVGHQPYLGRVAARLISGAEANWTVKKGGLWWLTNRVRNDEARIVVRAVIAPDLV
jgi:phosphohistidine phosphatase